MEEKTPIISFRNADIAGGDSTVIYDLDMDIYPGDFVYIVGKVGTGKTSIIRTMIAESKLKKGTGTVCGYELAEIKDKDVPYLRRKLVSLGSSVAIEAHRNLGYSLEKGK